MAGMWKNSDSSNSYTTSGGSGTRTVVESHCHTEEVQPGMYIRKCEKTQQTFKHCLGRPDEMVQSIKEYTEEDVTHRMDNGQFSFDSAQNGSSYFPGLRNDIEAIEGDIFGGINSFFEAAEDIKDGIFGAIGIFDNDSSSSSSRNKLEVRIEGPVHQEALPKKDSNGEIDLSGLARLERCLKLLRT